MRFAASMRKYFRAHSPSDAGAPFLAACLGISFQVPIESAVDGIERAPNSLVMPGTNLPTDARMADQAYRGSEAVVLDFV